MKKMFLIILLPICSWAIEPSSAVTYSRHEFINTARHIAHILQVDPTCSTITLEHALEQREPVSSMVERTGAMAGINAGFFRRGGMLNGNSLNLLKIGPEIYADPGLRRGTLAWNSPHDARINSTYIQWSITTKQQALPVSRINHPYISGELVVYLPTFGIYTTVPHGCTQVVVINNTVSSIISSSHCKIPRDGFVIAFDSQYAQTHAIIDTFALGNTAQFTTDSGLATYMVNGAGTLIKDGIVQSAESMMHELQAGNALTQLPDEASINYHDTKQAEWLINGQHPRTAVGLTKTGTWVFVVVEGRQRDVEGLSLPQLAEFMRTLKCEQALNLGGGGDSTLVFEGQVMNVPSGSSSTTVIVGQRPVSDAILVFNNEQ